MAAYFLANRLIPAGFPGRADLEVQARFWVWFGLAALSLLRPVRRAWIETLGIAAAAFAFIPLVNMFTTDRGMVQSIRHGDALFLSFDGVTLMVASLLGFAARRAAMSLRARCGKTGIERKAVR